MKALCDAVRPRSRLRVAPSIGACVVLLATGCGDSHESTPQSGGTEKSSPASLSSTSSPRAMSEEADKALSFAAMETFLEWSRHESNQTRTSLPRDIPQEFWAAEIAKLQPLRVYVHRMNLVMVQSAANGVEEGTYICSPLSSHLPSPQGEDGFTFLPPPASTNEELVLSNGSRKYRRRIEPVP